MAQLCKSFNSEINSRMRQRDDFVGKRVLCLTKSFDIPTPSPAQISSSLWIPEAIEALRDVAFGKAAGSKSFNYPGWCPKHHHHHSQDDGQNFIDLVNQSLNSNAKGVNFNESNPDYSEQANSSGKRSRSRLSGRKTSSIRPIRNSPLVNKKEDFIKRFGNPATKKEPAAKETENFPAYDCKICAQRQNIEGGDPQVSVRTLPWRLGTIRAASGRDINAKSFSLMIEFDHLDWHQRDWYQLWEDPSEQPEKQMLSVDTSLHFNGNKSLCTDQNNPMTQNENKTSESSANSFANNHQVSDNVPFTRRSPGGSFHAILVESSICCLMRSNSPLGEDKLWPALVFEPLIDEFGLFNSNNNELRVVEYLDPADDKLINQSDCDISPIIASLKSEFADLCRSQSINPIDIISTSNAAANSTIDLSKPDTSTPGGQDTLVKDNCSCWSPRVEFVLETRLFYLNCDNINDECPQNVAENSSQDETKLVSKSSIALSSRKLNTFNKYLRLFFKTRALLDSKKKNDIKPTIGSLAQDTFPTNDIIQVFTRYPSVYKKLKDWHLYQDAQFLLGNDNTAPLLVGNRVKVYRCSGATHWYTAVILSYDERDHLLTLIDDTVLERHQEDPTLLEMHFLDEKLAQSFLVGDIDINSRQNSLSWRPRPQRAAKNPRIPNSAHYSPDSRNGINKAKAKQSSTKMLPNSRSTLSRSPLPDVNTPDQSISSSCRNSNNKAVKPSSSEEGSNRVRSKSVKLANSDTSLVDDMFLVPRVSAFKTLKSRCMSQQKFDYSTSLEYLISDSLPSIKSVENERLYNHTKPNVTLEGRNFLSHRLRLEALDRDFEALECSRLVTTSIAPTDTNFKPAQIKSEFKPMDINTSTVGIRSDDSSTSLQASRFLSSTDSSSRTSVSFNVQLRFLDDAIAKQDEA